MNIKVKLHEGGHMPERHGAFCDLATKREERLSKGEVRILPLGVSMVLPKDSWGFVVPRSSTCLKHGIMLSSSVGVIEPEYCGDDDEWGFPAYAVRDTVIPAGMRICQFMAMPLMPEVEFEQVESTGEPNRGGYGSTGEIAHREPDSWQKLEDDANTGNPCSYFGRNVGYCEGCPSEDSATCFGFIMNDIIERTKKLAGVCGSGR